MRILRHVSEDSVIWKENKAPEEIRTMKNVYCINDVEILIVLANSDDDKFDQISIFHADKLKLLCRLGKVSNIFIRNFTKLFHFIISLSLISYYFIVNWI